MKGKIYKMVVRRVMLYGLETVKDRKQSWRKQRLKVGVLFGNDEDG